MARDDESASRFAGSARLAVAIMCFIVSIGAIGGAIVMLPLEPRLKLFLAGAAALLTLMFAFLAVLAYLTLRRTR